jgi:hypothetical protein
MARKITSGIVGRSVLGSLSTDNNSLQSVITNANVLLEPNGTGIVQSTKDIQINAQNTLRLADADSSNYVALRAPATVSANVTYTFPAAATNTNFLQTNATGDLSWTAPFVAVANQTADTGTYYPTITTATSGTVSTVSVSNSKLSFVPSTGMLTSTGITATTATISGGTINGTTIGATTAAAGTFTAITETSSIAYKENINPITNALDAILQLVGVTYDRKDGSSINEAGLIAEDTANVLPNLVTYKAGKPEGINYTKLSAYLIEAVKSLKQEIEQLKSNK